MSVVKTSACTPPRLSASTVTRTLKAGPPVRGAILGTTCATRRGISAEALALDITSALTAASEYLRGARPQRKGSHATGCRGQRGRVCDLLGTDTQQHQRNRPR